jgi:hypothetical protein
MIQYSVSKYVCFVILQNIWFNIIHNTVEPLIKGHPCDWQMLSLIETERCLITEVKTNRNGQFGTRETCPPQTEVYVLVWQRCPLRFYCIIYFFSSKASSTEESFLIQCQCVLTVSVAILHMIPCTKRYGEWNWNQPTRFGPSWIMKVAVHPHSHVGNRLAAKTGLHNGKIGMFGAIVLCVHVWESTTTVTIWDTL